MREHWNDFTIRTKNYYCKFLSDSIKRRRARKISSVSSSPRKLSLVSEGNDQSMVDLGNAIRSGKDLLRMDGAAIFEKNIKVPLGVTYSSFSTLTVK